MISVLISSVNGDHFAQVSENIAATIGVPYEIIVQQNCNGQKGLCQVYNELAAKANYDILCFMHEDVIIHSENWGKVLYNIFNTRHDVGLVGVIGGSYKPLSPSTWNGSGISNSYANIIQSYKYVNKEPYTFYRNPNNVSLARVACVDGLFMCTHKRVFEQYKFDEQTFKGFHVYDIDYALAVGQQYKITVTYDILINHLSEGKYATDWMADNLRLHKKWSNLLPLNVEGFNRQQQLYIEKITFKYFVDDLINLNMSISHAYKVLWRNSFFKLSPSLFFKLHYYILKIKLKGEKLK